MLRRPLESEGPSGRLHFPTPLTRGAEHVEPSVLRVPRWGLVLDVPNELIATVDEAALPRNW